MLEDYTFLKTENTWVTAPLQALLPTLVLVPETLRGMPGFAKKKLQANYYSKSDYYYCLLIKSDTRDPKQLTPSRQFTLPTHISHCVFISANQLNVI